MGNSTRNMINHIYNNVPPLRTRSNKGVVISVTETVDIQHWQIFFLSRDFSVL